MSGRTPPRGAVTITERRSARGHGTGRYYDVRCEPDRGGCGWAYTGAIKTDAKEQKRNHRCIEQVNA